MVQAHPWHGVDPIVGDSEVLIYIENAPLAKMKYETDMAYGLLKVDRPLETSSLPPAAYGFIPRTLCDTKVAHMNSRLRGDRAALDVFLLSEKPIEVHGVLAQGRIIAGVPVKDEGFVDDKLIAVLARDAVLGACVT
ncbi:MAG: inorganic pyrophosphatase [Gammaproteobacteria bacterium]|jgi:inorganic pyrophosphatase